MPRTLFVILLGAMTLGIIPLHADSPCTPYNIGVEWLYWLSKEQGLIAGSLVDDFPDPTLKIVDVNTIDPGFVYSSGVRAYAGYIVPSKLWEIELIYTYMPIHSIAADVRAAGLVSDTYRQVISPNLSGFPALGALLDSPLSSLFTKWNGDLSYLDVDLSRVLHFGRGFNLQPHIGFRAAWMKQNFLIQGTLIVPSSINAVTFFIFNDIEKFRGLGIEGGLWLNWDVFCGFSLVGHIGGSILSSRIHLTQEIEGLLGEGGPTVFDAHLTFRNPDDAIPTFDCFVGLQYIRPLCGRLVIAYIGWEQHTFFNINHLSVWGGNFSTQGLNLGLDICF